MLDGNSSTRKKGSCVCFVGVSRLKGTNYERRLGETDSAYHIRLSKFRNDISQLPTEVQLNFRDLMFATAEMLKRL